jgi:hypothetical protein
MTLSARGTVTMPLADMFWSSYFGMCRDQFDVNWMIGYDTQSKQGIVLGLYCIKKYYKLLKGGAEQKRNISALFLGLTKFTKYLGLLFGIKV